MTERLRVFLVDDHDVARAGARHYLEEHFDIVGEAVTVVQGIAMAVVIGANIKTARIRAGITVEQRRSKGDHIEAMKRLREGVIGDVLVAKAWNIQRRGSIGHEQPSEPPVGVDYDAWVGPAEFVPFQKNRFHYAWHWWYNFGTGDIGNDGVHDIDIARWGLGATVHPETVTALGGKYFFDDDQQFPDTATCVFEYPDDGQVGHRRQLIFEMRLWYLCGSLNLAYRDPLTIVSG